MKKQTMIALIVAVALILCGGILVFFGLRTFDFDRLEKPAQKTYTVLESFDSIQIDTGTCDVTFVKTDGEFRAVCPETEKLNYIVIVEDGVLRISAMDMRHWYDFIGINLGEMEMTVYLPEDQYESVSIQTDAGDVEIPQGFFFNTAQITASTGDVSFAATVMQQLAISVSTGDVDIENTAIGQLELHSSTGDQELENLQISGDLNLRSSSGDICAKNVVCANFRSQSSTGDAELENVLAEEFMQITMNTGRVRIQNCDTLSAAIETTTGDVSGNFLTPKWFIAESNTGDVDVPLSREGGECRIRTSTGDIRFH